MFGCHSERMLQRTFPQLLRIPGRSIAVSHRVDARLGVIWTLLEQAFTSLFAVLFRESAILTNFPWVQSNASFIWCYLMLQVHCLEWSFNVNCLNWWVNGMQLSNICLFGFYIIRLIVPFVCETTSFTGKETLAIWISDSHVLFREYIGWRMYFPES